MISLTQVLLIIVITILTALLVVIGIQVVNILKEVRLSLQKMNQILDDMAKLTHSVSQPIVNLSGLAEGLKGGVKIVSLIRRVFGRDDEAQEDDLESPPPQETLND